MRPHVLLLWLTALPVGTLGRADPTLDNGVFRLVVEEGRFTALQVDPAGEGRYGASWLIDMGFEELAVTEQTRIVQDGDALRIEGLRAEAEDNIALEHGGEAALLQPGQTLGQSFEVRAGRASRIQVHLPTWNTEDSAATLTLRRDGPRGPLVASRRLVNVPDNSWQEMVVQLGPGRYYLELSDPEGMIGWWGAREHRYAAGQAYVNGEPVQDFERHLRVFIRRPAGEAVVTARADGARLELAASVQPLPGETAPSRRLLMKLRWDNTGYEVSGRTVPFSRFFTDTMRYMPVQQLKRWQERGGRYELSFAGCGWIEADGTGNHDLRVHGDGLGLSWHVPGQEATLAWSTQPGADAGAVVNRVVIEAKPRANDLPEVWPRFVLPDEGDTEAANTFLYERLFTYPPVWGPGAWLAWNALGRGWQGGPHLGALRQSYESYPITEEGYVHTWGGASEGWPFPDPSRYDTRHFDTNARFILGCWHYAGWTGDTDFLLRQAERLRRAMHYQLTVLGGLEGLIVSASKDVNGRHQGVGNNYWDILPFGHLDAYANALWYASLEAMAQIEEMIRDAGGVETRAPRRVPGYYRRLAVRVQQAYSETFWDDEKGRYIGCVDIDGKRHDYGFTFVNLEAMAYGLADDEQAHRIYHWMETEPTSSGEADTYSAWVFAPRANTLHNPQWRPGEGKIEDVPQDPWWHFGWLGTPYGDQCQDGGAILYTSFYDLMARLRHQGADDAWQRWREIIERWQLPDHLCGGPPLYRGEHPQQVNPGAVGLDIPFPESGLVPGWLLYGVLGVQPTSRGLRIAPRLPADLPWIEARNVAYRGSLLNIRSDGREVLITCETPGEEFSWRQELGLDGEILFEGTGNAGKD